MRLGILMLPLLVSGCVTATQGSLDALCLSSRSERAAHAAALAETPDDRAAITGANLINTIDAACAR